LVAAVPHSITSLGKDALDTISGIPLVACHASSFEARALQNKKGKSFRKKKARENIFD
jgi:hypothetical protein